ncbi:MAG: DNA repair protein RecO [Rikenellaceae bacterium]
MAKNYKSRGVVLTRVKYGDSSIIVQLFGEECGRQSYMVQGVKSRRSQGSKMALFQPLHPLEFVASWGSGRLHRFSEVQSGMILRSTPFDVRRMTISLFIAEVIYRLVREDESNKPLFDFIWSSIETLDLIDEGVANFHLYFLVNLSRFLGFFPGNSHSDGDWFDPSEGLFTAQEPSCLSKFTPPLAERLRDFIECDVRHLGEIPLSRRERVEFLESLLDYYSYHLDIRHSVESLDILREVF